MWNVAIQNTQCSYSAWWSPWHKFPLASSDWRRFSLIQTDRSHTTHKVISARPLSMPHTEERTQVLGQCIQTGTNYQSYMLTSHTPSCLITRHFSSSLVSFITSQGSSVIQVCIYNACPAHMAPIRLKSTLRRVAVWVALFEPPVISMNTWSKGLFIYKSSESIGKSIFQI